MTNFDNLLNELTSTAVHCWLEGETIKRYVKSADDNLTKYNYIKLLHEAVENRTFVEDQIKVLKNLNEEK
jgi:hypothetical protein